MKHHYTDFQIKEAYEGFLKLKNSSDYHADYRRMLVIDRRIKELKPKVIAAPNMDDEMFKLDLALKNERIKYFRKWRIQALVNPRWKIRLEDLVRSPLFQPGDTKSKFLAAFFGGPVQGFHYKEERNVQVSSRKASQDDRTKKMLCWALIKNTKIRIRALARIFGVNNKTISNWFDDVEELTAQEQHTLLNEIFSGKNMFVKKDALDTKPSTLNESHEFSVINSHNSSDANALE